MKIRDGFVSNSSSSSFLILLSDQTKHLAHYNWNVTEEEYVFESEKDGTYDEWDGDKWVEYPSKTAYLESEGYNYYNDSDHGSKVYCRDQSIYKLTEVGLGRSTAMGFGDQLEEYAQELLDNDWSSTCLELGAKLVEYIHKYGKDNLMFLRESDEGMGGYLPSELSKLCKDNLFEMEWH